MIFPISLGRHQVFVEKQHMDGGYKSEKVGLVVPRQIQLQ